MKLKFLSLKRFCISHKQKFIPNRFRENHKKTSIDLETNAKSNKSLDKTKNQQNKSITEKLDSDNQRTEQKTKVPFRE